MNEKINNTIDPEIEDAVTDILFHYWKEWVDGTSSSERILSPAEKAFLSAYRVSAKSPLALRAYP